MNHRPLIVVATPQGQLGNTLTHFAHLRAFAIEKRLPLVHLAFDRYSEFFPATDRDLFSSYSPDRPIYEEPLVVALIGLFKTFLTVMGKSGDSIPPELARTILDSPPQSLASVRSIEMRNMLMLFGCALTQWLMGGQFKSMPIDLMRVQGEEFLNLSEDPRMARAMSEQRMLVFDGWSVRDPSSYEKHKRALFEYFTPSSAIRGDVEKAVGVARAGCDLLIGIHIRRGDYKTFMGGRYFFEISQYLKWMEVMRDAIPERRVGFLVCSDAPFSKGDFPGIPVEFGPGSAIGDMYALGRCDLIAGPPSTFTGWASQYGGVPLWYFQGADQPLTELAAFARSAVPGLT